MRQDPLLRRALSASEFGPFVLLVVELAVFYAINPEFLSILNISNTLTFTVELAELMERVAGDLLQRVGIGKAIPASTPIASLSGGERQAVAIARAMHFDSDLMILDEPTNNLGVAETQGVLRFVRNARDSGRSCIFIAHNIHHVFQVVDRIVVMRDVPAL